MSNYAIWNKKDPVITPIGEVLSAEQWIDRYPVAGLDSVTVICADGEINGGFFGTLGQMMKMYENNIDFSACTTDEERLALIEEYEYKMSTLKEFTEPTPEERQAAALEAIASGQTTENVAAMNALLNGEE